MALIVHNTDYLSNEKVVDFTYDSGNKKQIVESRDIGMIMTCLEECSGQWAEVNDFGWLRQTASPNWETLPPGTEPPRAPPLPPPGQASAPPPHPDP